LLDLYGAYLRSRLKADAGTGDLYTTLVEANDALRAADDRQRQALVDLQDALSARNHAAFQLGELLGQFELAVRSVVKRNSKDPLYVHLFASPVSRLISEVPMRFIERVKRIEATLVTVTEDSVLKSWIPVLAEGRATVETAIAGWQRARDAHSAAHFAEMEERQRWLRTYEAIYADLVKLYPGRRAKVNDFFRPGPKAIRRADAAHDVAVTPDMAPPKAGEAVA
jgi:hypothetical protein